MVPIIAYNYGARKPARIMQTIKLAIAYAVGIMVVAVVVFQIFPVQLLGVFQASEEMLAIGVPALRTLSLCFWWAASPLSPPRCSRPWGRGC